MATGKSEEQIYKEAKKEVAAKRGFLIHLTVYIVVNILLVLIWTFVTGRGFPWFIFPLCGWGIGILFHYLGTFVFGREPGKASEEKETD